MSRPLHASPAPAQSGLSLVELLVALSVAALVMVPLLELLRTTAAASSHVAPRFALQREADFAVQRIAAQVRKGVPVSSFARAGDLLVETNGAVASTLAESVWEFAATEDARHAGQQLVEVNLTLERDGARASASATVRAGGLR